MWILYFRSLNIVFNWVFFVLLLLAIRLTIVFLYALDRQAITGCEPAPSFRLGIAGLFWISLGYLLGIFAIFLISFLRIIVITFFS